MKNLADFEKTQKRFVVSDFICPTQKREMSAADIVLWMNTIKKGRIADTNALFESPEQVDFLISRWNNEDHEYIAQEILKNV
jgi:adenylylsulfate kinase